MRDGARPSPCRRRPVFRLCTPRLLLRCWSPADAPALHEAVRASLEHLRPWMEWARDEPGSSADHADLVRRFRRDFMLGRQWTYGIFDRRSGAVRGGAGLHPRVGEGAAELGYWIHAGHTGRGLATEAAAALVRSGFEALGLHRIELHCQPDNAGSAAVARKLGFRHQVTVPGQVTGPAAPPRDMMIWVLLRGEYPATPASRCAVEAYDDTDARLL